MNDAEKAMRLADHYKIEGRASMSAAQLFKAVKAKSKKPYGRITDIYDDVFGSKAETKPASPIKRDTATTIEPVIEKKPTTPVEAVSDRREVIVQPLQPHTAEQSVEVRAPTLHFNLAPQSVVVRPGDVTLVYTLQRLGQYAFVFVAGVAFGLLLAGKVASKLGLSYVAKL